MNIRIEVLRFKVGIGILDFIIEVLVVYCYGNLVFCDLEDFVGIREIFGKVIIIEILILKVNARTIVVLHPGVKILT